MIIKTKNVIVKKLYNGHVSVRDYIVESTILQGKDLTVYFNHHKMTIPLEQLANKFQFHKQRFKSKFDNNKYELIDFPFVPDSLIKE